MNKKFPTLSHLRQIAKNLQTEKMLKWHKALDEAAKQLGYSNYKNYLNQSKQNIEAFLKTISLEKDFSKKKKLAILFVQETRVPFKNLLDIIKQFQPSEEYVQSLCESLDLKNEVQKFMTNYFLGDEFTRELQSDPLKEHFIVKSSTVKNLFYEIDGKVLRIEGDYDLSLKFEFEIPNEDKNLPHFKREPMFGDFEITMDQSKKITIVHISSST